MSIMNESSHSMIPVVLLPKISASVNDSDQISLRCRYKTTVLMHNEQAGKAPKLLIPFPYKLLGICLFVDNIGIINMSIFSKLVIALIRSYQILLSPDHSFWAKSLDRPPYCKHIPSCSDYGVQAVEKHGGLKGSWLAIKRIGRCNPWSKGGYDPVPDKKGK